MADLNSKNNTTVMLGILFLALAYMSIKLSVPALPLLQYTFHTSASMLKLSASLFLICFAISQLIIGSIARFMYRKHIIYLSMGFAIIGTLISMTAYGITQFMLGRCIEGLGMGAASPICRILMSDRLDRMQIAKKAIYLGVIFNLMPFIAPTLGQYIIIYLGWRFIFAVFFLLLVIYLLSCWHFMEETHPNKQLFSIKQIANDYSFVIKDKHFWSVMIGLTFFISIQLGYYMAIPYWYMVHFHVSDRYYTFLALFTALPNLLTYYLARFFIAKKGAKFTMQLAYWLAPLSLIIAFVFYQLQVISVAAYICPLVIIAISTGLIAPSMNVSLLSLFHEHRGIVSALIPVFPFLGAAVMFLVLTHINLNAYWPYMIVLSVVCLAGLINSILLARVKEF